LPISLPTLSKNGSQSFSLALSRREHGKWRGVR
jgi:hypothetical protein